MGAVDTNPVPVVWKTATLETKTEADGTVRQLPIEEFVLAERRAGVAPRPLFVWLRSPSEKVTTATLETKVFATTEAGILLQRFRCLKIELASITDPGLVARYGRTTRLVVIDPLGGVVGSYPLGKKDAAVEFNRFIGDVYKVLFEMPARRYADRRRSILLKRRILRIKRAGIERKRPEGAETPEPADGAGRRLARIEEEARALAKIEKDLEFDAALKAIYRQKPKAGATK